MSANPGKWPVKIFKAVYLILLAYNLITLGISLSTRKPSFIEGLLGKENELVGIGLYWFMLLSAGAFVFASYMSFEAFEDQKKPFEKIEAPKNPILRLLEPAFRFWLVLLLTVKLWSPRTDDETALFLFILSISLLAWYLIVRNHIATGYRQNAIRSVVALSFFTCTLWLISSDQQLASRLSLLVSLLLFVSTFVMLTFSIRLLIATSPRSLPDVFS